MNRSLTLSNYLLKVNKRKVFELSSNLIELKNENLIPTRNKTNMHIQSDTLSVSHPVHPSGAVFPYPPHS